MTIEKLFRLSSCATNKSARQLANLIIRPMSNMAKGDVLFNVHSGKKGVITLNRPKALNALNLGMAKEILPALQCWQDVEKLSLIIIEGVGEKAFCAGGDIRAITSASNKGSIEQAEFFAEEYKLNNLIGTLSVPYVALIDGITMGGGVGLSVHGRFRVATERTVFAMPETGIGLFPDVGGSHFLPRLNGELGTFLALSGHRLKGSDCLAAGIATHAVKSSEVSKLKQDLLQLPASIQSSDVESLLSQYTKVFHGEYPTTFSLADKMKIINSCFAHNSVEEIIQSLVSYSGNEAEKKWCTDLSNLMLKMSPTSMKVTLRQLREGKQLSSLAKCLEMEYRLVRRFCEDFDFYEGVRSVLVDRDGSPKWQPDSLEKVKPEIVDRYFSPLPPNEELKLSK